MRAQCELSWLPGLGIRGTDGPVYAVHRWDPDGAGPAAPRMVLGGEFSKAGAIVARVASWDPATGSWAALGSGVLGQVNSLATAANGDLLVGGSFSVAGGFFAPCIARWNGTNWAALGAGVNGRVRDIAVLPNGDIVIVGGFSASGSTQVANVARWDGTTWSPLGSGSPSGLSAVLALPNGEIVVGGEFSAIGGVAANRIARWDGVAWHPLGTGVDGTIFQHSTIAIYDLALLPNGSIVAAGNFLTAGGIPSPGVAAWSGSGWMAMGAGLAGVVTALHVTPAGTVLANAPTVAGAPGISEWDGLTWQTVTQGLSNPGNLEQSPNGEIIAVGQFSIPGPGGEPIHNVARWDGAAWQSLGSGSITSWFASSLELDVRAVATAPDGTLYATGLFQIVDGVLLNGIARFNGSTWDPVGSGLGIGSWPIPYPWPLALLAMQNGDIVVGGRIVTIAGAPAAHVVRWDGTAWDNLGGGVGAAGVVTTLAELPDGDLVVGGDFTATTGGPGNHIARWDGVAWHALGSGLGGPCASVIAAPNGDILAVGSFTTAGGLPANRVARWNGSTWSPLGAGPTQDVTKMRQLPNGDIVAIVVPPPATTNWTVQRWNGATWTSVGPPFQASTLTDLVVLPDGDLLVTGSYFGGFTSRWDGTAWSTVASTSTGFATHTWLPDGDLVVGGGFDSAGGWLSPRLARLHSSCTATAIATGAGCAGSGGNNVLRATSLPWLGSTVRAAGTELPMSALVSQVWGLSELVNVNETRGEGVY